MPLLYISLFLSPILILVIYFGGSLGFEFEEFYSALKFTFQQSLLSASLCLVLGFLGGVGLSAYSHYKHYKWIEIFILIPALVPSLFTVLVYLSWVHDFHLHWSSLTAIVVNHTLMNVGLFSVGMARVFQNRLSNLAEWSYVEGGSRWVFYRFAGWRLLEKDVVNLFYFIFALCFMSFAVPLMVSSLEYKTLETLIYEKVRVVQDIDVAMSYALVQIVILLVLAFLLPKVKLSSFQSGKNGFRFYGFRPFLIIPLLPAMLITFTLVIDVLRFVNRFWMYSEWTMSLGILSFYSILVGVAVALVVFILSLVPVFYSRSKIIRVFLLGYSAPSLVLVGFAFYMLKVSSAWGETVLIALALSLVLYPLVYRFFLDAKILSLKKQVEVAEVLGASRGLILKKILMPQLQSLLFLSMTVAAFWAISDYALTPIVSGQKLTLGHEMLTVLNSYRLELSFNVLLCMVVCVVVVYGVLHAGFFLKKRFYAD